MPTSITATSTALLAKQEKADAVINSNQLGATSSNDVASFK